MNGLNSGRFLLLIVPLLSCGSPAVSPDPVGEPFPSVTGTSLDGTETTLPADLAGAPAVLLIGFEMESQFDIDRWILGLVQAETPVELLELPTIPGMFPGLFAGTIDDGMRGGIPSEDWGSVVTLYRSDASKVAGFTGKGDRNARVLLLDAGGEVVWFHDRGYSAAHVLELDAAARELADL